MTRQASGCSRVRTVSCDEGSNAWRRRSGAQIGGTTDRSRPTARAGRRPGRRRRRDRGRGAGRLRLGHQHRQERRAADHAPDDRRQRARSSKTLGVGVTADHDQGRRRARQLRRRSRQFTDTIRTEPEQKQIYGIYINDINAHGGIARPQDRSRLQVLRAARHRADRSALHHRSRRTTTCSRWSGPSSTSPATRRPASRSSSTACS